MEKHRDGNGSCGSLLYWCIIMHEREREREREGERDQIEKFLLSRSVGG